MKKRSKVMLTALCAVLLVVGSVFGTVAYFTDSEAVTNTFTVGQVKITMDEADTDNSTPGENDRDVANQYHLIPGQTIKKDPTIHVDADSEACWLFVKVENGLAAYEAATTTGENAYTNLAGQIQIVANGWTLLEGNVYYQPYTKGQADKTVEVFEEFKIDGMANTVTGWDKVTPDNDETKIVVTAYAVQAAGFETAQAAWNATFANP